MALSDQQMLESSLNKARAKIPQRPGWTTDLFEIGGQFVFPLGGCSGGISTAVIFYLVTWDLARTEAYSAACEVGRFVRVDAEWAEGILSKLQNDLSSRGANCRRLTLEGGDMGRAPVYRQYGL